MVINGLVLPKTNSTRMIKEAVTFERIKVQTVAKEGIEPYFETILACGGETCISTSAKVLLLAPVF